MSNITNSFIALLKSKAPFISVLRRKYRAQKAYQAWQQSGEKLETPHIIKQNIIKRYAAEYKTDTLIETGTYLGDMIASMKDEFTKIISIELSKDLYTLAQKRFFRLKHIEIINGDSSDVIPGLLKLTERKCLFWLDGHFSGGLTQRGKKDTPIMEELTNIFKHCNKRHVILIDDARYFNGKNGYPTIEILNNIVKYNGYYSLAQEYDILILTPKRC